MSPTFRKHVNQMETFCFSSESSFVRHLSKTSFLSYHNQVNKTRVKINQSKNKKQSADDNKWWTYWMSAVQPNSSITQQFCCICTLVKQLGHISLFFCSFSRSLLSESVHHKAAQFLLHHSIPPLTFPSFSTHSLLIAAACLADSEDSLHARITLNCDPECKQGNNNYALAEKMGGFFFSFTHSKTRR